MSKKKNGDLKQDLKDLQSKWNVTELSPQWFQGGALTNRAMAEQLEMVGVTHIINVAAELVENDRDALKGCDCPLFTVYWGNGFEQPRKHEADFLAAWEWVQAAIARALYHDEEPPSFYVHCNAGVHRGPMMAAFLLAVISGSDLDRAMFYLRSRRPVVEIQEDEEYLTNFRATAAQALECLRTGKKPDAGETPSGPPAPPPLPPRIPVRKPSKPAPTPTPSPAPPRSPPPGRMR